MLSVLYIVTTPPPTPLLSPKPPKRGFSIATTPCDSYRYNIVEYKLYF